MNYLFAAILLFLASAAMFAIGSFIPASAFIIAAVLSQIAGEIGLSRKSR